MENVTNSRHEEIRQWKGSRAEVQRKARQRRLEEKVQQPKPGRPWKKEGTFDEFLDADQERAMINCTRPSFQAKVRRRADGRFVVLVRAHADAVATGVVAE